MNDKITILLADDEAPLRTLIGDRLREEGFEVIVVEDKDGLVEKSGLADVLLVDGRLAPAGVGGVGVETVARLVAEGRISNEVPLIFYSIIAEGHEMFEKGLASLRHRGRRYLFLNRPFELDLLIDCISDELQTKGRRGATGG